MSEPKPFPSVAEFLFNAPLYARFKLADDLEDVKRLYRRETCKVDGHCPYCHKTSTFTVNGHHIAADKAWSEIRARHAYDQISIFCARDDHHVVRFYILIRKLVIQKIGQHPSLADIVHDVSSIYKQVLKGDNFSEFHMAIGLAAHGVGIGSFVYLRRIFERLIRSRFDEFKDEEGWKDEDFTSKRMDEKIELLRDRLPSFLVENKRIYSILSLGIHELEEGRCLQFFDVMKNSIIIILDEDKRKKEELDLRKNFAQAIAGFEAKRTPPAEAADPKRSG